MVRRSGMVERMSEKLWQMDNGKNESTWIHSSELIAMQLAELSWQQFVENELNQR